MLIQTALKEWSVAVDALANGDTSVLLRKGGIKESQSTFSAESETVILFPTFEHQKPELLKSAYQKAVVPVEKGWHPPTIMLTAWAEITHIFLTDDAEQISALADFHIWKPQLAQDRLKWKPKQPLYVLTLRAYRLPSPVALPWQPEYGGCRSWLTFPEGVEVPDLDEPVIATADYQRQVDAIAAVLSR